MTEESAKSQPVMLKMSTLAYIIEASNELNQFFCEIDLDNPEKFQKEITKDVHAANAAMRACLKLHMAARTLECMEVTIGYWKELDTTPVKDVKDPAV